MTIELLAVAPDGWGLLRSAEGCWLLRPPYSVKHRFPITQAQVERGVLEEDFVPRSETFDDWGAVARFLEAHAVGDSSPEELERSRDAAFRLLGRATAEQASGHLDRLQLEIEAGRGTTTVKALHALLGGPAVAAVPELVRRIAELLARASVASPALRSIRPTQFSWVVSDEDGVRELTAKVAARGHLLLPAAA
ncbi:MAG: hypothetical protein IPK26_24615 [Planctomycetes bacterium]|nr:hypothetical protein [Planctomycetota bacterium]